MKKMFYNKTRNEERREVSVKKTFNNIKIYLSINVIQRKVIFLSVLIFAWLFLLLGAIFSPNKQLFTNEQLSTQKGLKMEQEKLIFFLRFTLLRIT